MLQGPLRCQCDYFIAVCGAEARVAMTEGVLERFVQYRYSDVEETFALAPEADIRDRSRRLTTGAPLNGLVGLRSRAHGVQASSRTP